MFYHCKQGCIVEVAMPNLRSSRRTWHCLDQAVSRLPSQDTFSKYYQLGATILSFCRLGASDALDSAKLQPAPVQVYTSWCRHSTASVLPRSLLFTCMFRANEIPQRPTEQFGVKVLLTKYYVAKMGPCLQLLRLATANGQTSQVKEKQFCQPSVSCHRLI